MVDSIKTIQLPLPLHMKSVNCYFIRTPAGFFLIDAGWSGQQSRLEQELIEAGCNPGDLKLILITHGDFDHTGCAAYLRQKFNARIAMHPNDAGMAEFGDMFWNRKISSKIFNKIAAFLFGFFKSDQFTPDILLEDGADLSEHGLPAQIISTPGHSSGSICILYAGDAPDSDHHNSGVLFCGDLLVNSGRHPILNSLTFEKAAILASVQKLKAFDIKTVYPGHGKAFGGEWIMKIYNNLQQ